MNNKQYHKWALELTNQEYKGSIKDFLLFSRTPTFDMRMQVIQAYSPLFPEGSV